MVLCVPFLTGRVSKQHCMREWLPKVLRRKQTVTASNSKGGNKHIQVCTNHFFFLFPFLRDKGLELQMGKTRHLVRMVRLDFFDWRRILSWIEPKSFYCNDRCQAVAATLVLYLTFWMCFENWKGIQWNCILYFSMFKLSTEVETQLQAYTR